MGNVLTIDIMIISALVLPRYLLQCKMLFYANEITFVLISIDSGSS